MLNLDAAFEAELAGKTLRPVLVYEIVIDPSTTLRYSSQAVTWGGNSYTRLAVSQSPIIQSMNVSREHSFRVEFSNVTHTLRSYLQPVDLLTGRRLYVRRLLKDANGDPIASSMIEGWGVIEQPRLADQSTIELSVAPPWESRNATIPTRRTWDVCQARFADGVDCNYQFTTSTTSAEITPSTGPIPLVDGSKFADGDEIKVGASVAVTIASGGGTNSITVDTAIVWASGAQVKFNKCNRDYSDCQLRERTHEFLGFLPDVARFSQSGNPIADGQADYGHPDPNFPQNRSGRVVLDVGEDVPLILGRRITSGHLIESVRGYFGGRYDFRLLSEGEINRVVGYIADSTLYDDESDDTVASGKKTFGIFYRPGTLGVDDEETGAEYDADPVTWLRQQNRDGSSRAAGDDGQTYSRSAYVIVVFGNADVQELVNDFILDVEGVLVITYVSGVAQAAAFSRNPIWLTLLMLTNPRFGLGKRLTSADFDVVTTEAAAGYCDDKKPAQVANTTVKSASGSSETYRVDSTEGFYRGMDVLYNGATGSHVIDVRNNDLVLSDARVQNVGDTIQGNPERYSSDLVLDGAAAARDQIARVMSTCLGYITFDEDGNLQLRAEKAEAASAGHFRDIGADPGFEIVDGSFRWLDDDEDTDRSINRLGVQFRNEKGEDKVSSPPDANNYDHQADNEIREEVLTRRAIKGPDHAARVATLEFKRRSLLGSGCRFRTGHKGARVQPGDVIEVTHAIPDWTGQFVRVTKIERPGLGDDDEALPELTCIGYDATIYGDFPPPTPFRPDITAPAITLTLNIETLGRVILEWEADIGATTDREFTVYKDTQSMGTSPSPVSFLANAGATNRYEYVPRAEEYGQTLYFAVTSRVSAGGRVVSNEVTATPTASDPTSGPTGPNLVAYGDFNRSEEWEQQSLTATYVLAAASTGDFTDEANAYDGDEGTFARGQYSSGSPTEQIYTFPTGTPTREGWVEALFTGPSPVKHLADASYSTDEGATWIVFAGGWPSFPTDPGGATTYYKSENLGTVTMADLRVRLRGRTQTGHGSTSNLDAYEIRFADIGSQPFSLVSNNVATIRGDGVDYYYVRRRFPFARPEVGDDTIQIGQEITTKIRLERCTDGAALTHDVEVFLEEAVSGTTWVLATIPAASVLDAPMAFAILFAAPADLSGEMYIGVRTKSTNAVCADKLAAYYGRNTGGDWAPAPVEVDYAGDWSVGRVAGFSPGSWSPGDIKESTIVTS